MKATVDIAIVGAGAAGIAAAVSAARAGAKTLLLDHVLWEEAKRRGIVMREFRLFGNASNTFVAALPVGKEVDFSCVPLVHKHEPVWWVKHESILNRRLGALVVLVPTGGRFSTF